MTPEEYEALLMEMQGKLLQPSAPAAPPPARPDRRLTVAPIPSSMHGNDATRPPWGCPDS